MKVFVRLFVASLMAQQVTAADQYNNNAQYNNNNNNNAQYNSNNNNNNNYNSEYGKSNGYNYENENDAEAEDYYNNEEYDAEYAYENNGFLDFATCDAGVVQVTNVKIMCSSPYAYSYGNGAKRNSPLCDYGDKATISVFFDVTKSLGSNDNIYIDMGVYALKNELELLWEKDAADLSKLVSHSCTDEGSYAFRINGTLASYTTDSSEFYPYVEIAFSTQADQKTDLGGVNVQCQLGQFYDAKFFGRNSRSAQGTRAGAFLKNFVIVGAVLGVIGAGAYVVNNKYRDNIEYQGTLDKINGYYNNMGWGEKEGEEGDEDEIDSQYVSEDASMHA
jgi:hypothetical protein